MSHIAATTWRRQILSSNPRHHDMQAGKWYFFFKRLLVLKDEDQSQAIAKDLHAELKPSVTSRSPRDCTQQQSCHPPYGNLQVSMNLQEEKHIAFQ
jgi:hypothetical protein